MHRMDWSPMAIKTTTYVVDDRKKPILYEKPNPTGHFSIDAGPVSPSSQAVNPGLIYDADKEQYDTSEEQYILKLKIRHHITGVPV
jgi:hypothetical protein